MKHKKEVAFQFPLRKDSDKQLSEEKLIDSDSDIDTVLKKFYSLTEKLQNDEWHQEYFLIYNSYTIDNR